MTLVCLAAERGHYRIDDDHGHTLLAPFFSVTDAETLAQRLADQQQQVVWLRTSDIRGARLMPFRRNPLNARGQSGISTQQTNGSLSKDAAPAPV
jgi:hypothetical protein